VWNLGAAICALDPERLSDALDPAFRFLPCAGGPGPGGWPSPWGRAVFLQAATGWMEHGASWVEWTRAEAAPARWTSGDTLFAWIAWAPAEIRAVAEAGAPGGNGCGCPAGAEAWAPTGDAADRSGLAEEISARGRHEFLLRRVGGTAWQVLLWREHPAGGNASLAGLLGPYREAAGPGLRRCPEPSSRAGPSAAARPSGPPGPSGLSGWVSCRPRRRKSARQTIAKLSGRMTRRATSFTS